MHVLSTYFMATMPEVKQDYYNDIMDTITYFQCAEPYAQLTELVQILDLPYPGDLMDDIDGILKAALYSLITELGIMLNDSITEFDQLVKIATSLKSLDVACNAQCVIDELEFNDDIIPAMSTILEAHGGLDAFDFQSICILISPKLKPRLLAAAQAAIESLTDPYGSMVDDGDELTQDQKRIQCLREMMKSTPKPDIIEKAIITYGYKPGESLDNLISLLRSDLNTLEPSNPPVAAVNLIALVTLSDTSYADRYNVSKQVGERIFTDMGFVMRVNENIDQMFK